MSALDLHRFLVRLLEDDSFRRNLVDDPWRVVADFALWAEEVAAVAAADEEALDRLAGYGAAGFGADLRRRLLEHRAVLGALAGSRGPPSQGEKAAGRRAEEAAWSRELRSAILYEERGAEGDLEEALERYRRISAGAPLSIAEEAVRRQRRLEDRSPD